MGESGLILMDGAMFSKSLIQFSVDGWGSVPCCLAWGRTIAGVMATSFKRAYASTVVVSAPDPMSGHCQPTPLPETPGHSQASLGQSLVGSLLLSPGFWCTPGLVCALRSLFPQSCVSSVIRSHWPPESNSLGVLNPFARSLGWETYCKS